MTIVYDPHQTNPGNLLVKKPQAITPGKFRLIFPVEGPFFSDSVELYQGSNLLVEGRDYLLSHIYPTSILRTARRAHGALWLINDAVTSGVTLTAHYLGHGKATPAQITAERQVNAKKIPSRCYWEDVIGVVYFPPVDIQFNRNDWKGEKEVMDALGLLAKKMSKPPSQPNPFENNELYEPQLLPPGFEYAGQGRFICKDANFANVVSRQKANGPYGNGRMRGKQRIKWTLKSPKNAASTGAVFFVSKLTQSNGPGIMMEVTVHGNVEITLKVPGSPNMYNLLRVNFPKAQLATGVTAIMDYDTVAGTYHFKMESSVGVIVDHLFDMNNPPSNIAALVVSSNAKWQFDQGMTMILSAYPDVGGELIFHEVPGQVTAVIDNVYEMLVHWKDEIDEMFRTSPAIAHVKNTNNPHRDSWGWLRAIQLNSIASDTALVDGRDQAALAAAINAQLPKMADLTGKKLLRHSANDQSLTGSFTTHPGVTSITGSKTTGVAANVESVTVFDPKAAMLLSKGGYKLSYVAPNGLRIRAGTNVLELLPTQSKATWNGKELLTPLTVGPHLPGGEAGGDGLFYGVSTPSVEMTGNGIRGVPFLATWIPPESSVKAQYAMRRLTDAFGYSDALVATPALVKKLDALFRGKLLMDKASINGQHTLAQSVQLTKTAIGLPKVSDVSDEELTISTAQNNELQKYVAADHIHDRAEFGIGNATTAKLGLIKFGGLVNDVTLALAGDSVLAMYKRVEDLEATVAGAGVDIAVDIVRYGTVGNRVLADQATFTAAMLTVKAQTYYLRKQYPVPVAAFNLAELFPSDVGESRFYIYVDMKNNAAFYSVSNKRLSETDTVTEIGYCDTENSVITFVEIRSVTRLGDFRELDEHIASASDHINYRPSSSELMGLAPPPVVVANGLTPEPSASTWLYDWRYGYSNIGAVTATFAVTAVQKRSGTVDQPLRLTMEFTGFSPDGAKTDWWASSNMRLQYRIDNAAKRFEIWLLGTFGSTTLPGTYIRSGTLPNDYLSQPLRLTVVADGNGVSASVRTLRLICQSGETVVLDVAFDETPSGRPLNAPDANWTTIFKAAGTVNLAMPINPKGKVVVAENSFEALRPVDFKSVKATVDVPGVLGMVRGLADWRCIDVNGQSVPNVAFSADGQILRCAMNPENRSLHRILKQICPIRYDVDNSVVMNLAMSVAGNDNTVVEIVLGGFVDSAGKLHRFSMLVNNSNYVTNPQGKLVVLGFAIDYATPKQVVIGAPAPLVSAAFNWMQLGKMPLVIKFSPGQVEATITIQNLKYIVVFSYSATTCTVRFSPGVGNSSFSTITHDLKPSLPQLGVTPAELFGDNASVWWGIGGAFDGQTTFEFDHSSGQTAMAGGGTKSLTSFSGYLEHLSAANAVRIFDEAIPDNELSLNPIEMKRAFIKRHTELDLTGNLFAISPDAVRITLDIPNKRLQAVVFRL